MLKFNDSKSCRRSDGQKQKQLKHSNTNSNNKHNSSNDHSSKSGNWQEIMSMGEAELDKQIEIAKKTCELIKLKQAIQQLSKDMKVNSVVSHNNNSEALEVNRCHATEIRHNRSEFQKHK